MAGLEYNNLRHSLSRRRGFTLVELLIAMAIMVFVAMAAVTVQRITTESYITESAKQDVNQNLRMAVYAIARDVRMAGNFYALLGPEVKLTQAYVPAYEVLDGTSGNLKRVETPGWFRHSDATDIEAGALSIYGTDGGTEKSDSLTILRADMESAAPVGYLSSTGYNVSTAGQLNLLKSFQVGDILNGDIILLVDDSKAMVLEVFDSALQNKEALAASSKIPIKTGGRFTPPASQVLPFSQGTIVYNLRDVILVTYYLDQDKNLLMADYHDLNKTDPISSKPVPTVLANNIEDFQVFYYMESDNVNMALVNQNLQVNFNYFLNDRVKAISIGLTAKSTMNVNTKKNKRPQLFNRKEASNLDDNYRATMTETIFLRNF